MIRHILNQLKNNWLSTLLLLLLLLATTIVLMLAIGGSAYRLRYFFQPVGYEIEDVATLYAGAKPESDEDSLKSVELTNRLKASPYVELVATNNPHLIYNYNRSQMPDKDGNMFSFFLRGGNADTDELMGIEVLEGRWLAEGDYQINNVVISPEMAEKLYGTASGVIGKQIEADGERFNIVGLCNSIRQNRLVAATPSLFFDLPENGVYTIKTKEGMEPEFAKSLESLLASIYGKDGYRISYETMKWQDFLVNLNLYQSLAEFLFAQIFMLLVALTSFIAVIWYTTERRQQEWSIRFALGRSKRQLVGYIFMENILILIPALLTGIGVYLLLQRYEVIEVVTRQNLWVFAIAILLMLSLLYLCVRIVARKLYQLDISKLLKSE